MHMAVARPVDGGGEGTGTGFVACTARAVGRSSTRPESGSAASNSMIDNTTVKHSKQRVPCLCMAHCSEQESAHSVLEKLTKSPSHCLTLPGLSYVVRYDRSLGH